MTEFFRVSHDTTEQRGFPWAQSIIKGLEQLPKCLTCGAAARYPAGNLVVQLEKTRTASMWPDVLGCGAWPVFIVSSRVLGIWEDHAIAAKPTGTVNIATPVPRGLASERAPDYHWIDGGALRDAKLDFEASGFVGVDFCSQCGRRTQDIEATYEKQRSATWPYVIQPASWGGRVLFTTDLSPTAFFCTQRVIHLASEFRLTNFRFVSTRTGGRGPSVRYL